MNRTAIRDAVFVLAVSLALRVAWWQHNGGPLSGDEPFYHGLAVQLWQGDGYVGQGEIHNPRKGEPTAYRNPGLPFVLSLIYGMTGEADYRLARAILAITTSLTAPAVYGLCLLLLRSGPLGLAAALSWASLQITLQHSVWLYAEPLTACLVTIALLLTVVADRRRSVFIAVAAGLVFGYAVLCRAYVLPMVLGPSVWLMLRNSRRQMAALIMAAALLPFGWAVRNRIQLGTFAVTTQTINLWLGNNSWARGSWAGDWGPQHAFLTAKYPGIDRMKEAERARLFLREAIHEARSDPGRFLWLLPRKAAVLFSPYSYLGMDWLYAILLPFVFVGGFRLAVDRRTRETLWIVGFPIVTLLAVALVTFGDVRYRHSVDPMLMVLASIGLSRFVPLRLSIRRSSARPHGPDRANRPLEVSP